MNFLLAFPLLSLVFRVTSGDESDEDDDFFKPFLSRFQCYGTDQTGCSTDFIDAHPKLSLAHNKLTRADTFMYLFTNNDAEKPELLHKCSNVTPPETNFNPKCKTEILIPASFSGACSVAIYREIVSELLKKGCCNVILVDYMWGYSVDLAEEMLNAKIVAKQLAKVVKILKKTYHLKRKDFICTGSSVGAHICGFIGQKTRLGVINGLDPIGSPIHEDTPVDERLDPGDADCVQVIHTSAGGCLPSPGCNFSCGTIDIWFNDGLEQKSAKMETVLALIKSDYVYATLNLVVGSHIQALQYYKASIRAKDCIFIAVRCKNYDHYKSGMCSSCGRNGNKCILVGADACDCLRKKTVKSKHKLRHFYLSTSDRCPYCSNTGLNTTGFHCKAPKLKDSPV
ncbi:inactive pancreatic lipase-related protein 1-like isoform X2 [Uloborus diversus]|uniref:inactive pancreatic lipase-related protein 1-like isoform X2 n=1 Tax=Uloborus diversus TaxID=327109 RepID=UPI00240A9643|nr:inactive pancreatic lipase-related protein 1-like isoform X2 [Uloborus diversus]